jgi:hypothetical protein
MVLFGMNGNRESTPGEPSAVSVYRLALIVSFVLVVLFYILTNLESSAPGLPTGYDSSYYLAYVKTIQQQGFVGYAQSVNYYNVLYPTISSIPAFLGVGSIMVEIILPVLLSSVTVGAATYLARNASNWYAGLYSVAFLPGWFALYRMGADYHAELFAMPFLLVSTSLFIRTRKDSRLTKTRYVLFVLCVVLASLAHVETTIFFVAVWIITSLLWLHRPSTAHSGRAITIMVFSGIAACAPLGAVWLGGILQLFAKTGGLVGTYSPVPTFWLEVFGPSAVLMIMGLGHYVLHVRRRPLLDFEVLVAVWGSLSILVGMVCYVLPTFPAIISDRALLLFPAPFAAGSGLDWLLRRIGTGHTMSFRRSAITVTIVAIVVTSATYPYVTPRYFQTYIDSNTISELNWLASNYHPPSIPIFVFNFPSACAGDLTLFYDNWVSATFGRHYSYMGTIGNLTETKATNYTSIQSRVVSYLMFQKLQGDGIVSSRTLDEHPIALVSAWYVGQATVNNVSVIELIEGISILRLGITNSSGILIGSDFNLLASESPTIARLCPSTA